MAEATSKPPFVRNDGLEWRYDELNFAWYVETHANGARGRDYRRIPQEQRDRYSQEQSELHQQGRVDRMDMNNVSIYPNDQSTLKPAKDKIFRAKRAESDRGKLPENKDTKQENSGYCEEAEWKKYPDRGVVKKDVEVSQNHKTPLLRSRKKR